MISFQNLNKNTKYFSKLVMIQEKLTFSSQGAILKGQEVNTGAFIVIKCFNESQ